MTADDRKLPSDEITEQDIAKSKKPTKTVPYPDHMDLPTPEKSRTGIPVSDSDWEWLKKLIGKSASFLSLNTVVSISMGAGVSFYIASLTLTVPAQQPFWKSPFFYYGTACFIVTAILGLVVLTRSTPAHEALEFMAKIEGQIRGNPKRERKGLPGRILRRLGISRKTQDVSAEELHSGEG